MKKGLKIFLGISIPLVLATGGFLVYRNYRRKKEDDLTIEIGTVDWNKRQVPYTIKSNGKFDSSSISNWRKDLVGKGEQDVVSSGKNKTYETNLPNGFIIRGTSLGKQKFVKIIDFNSKTIKDYVGSNVNNDISTLNKNITNLFI